jgi:hypothetical protein
MTAKGLKLLPATISDFQSSLVQAKGGMPLVGSGEGGAATLDDLAKRAVGGFPSMFEAGGKPASTAEDNAGGSGPSPLWTRLLRKRSAQSSAKKKCCVPPFMGFTAVERASKMKEGFRLKRARARRRNCGS